MTEDKIADELRNIAASIEDGATELAGALNAVARALHALGNADAATPMGAVEALGVALKEGAESIAMAIGEANMEYPPEGK